jgi:hypothetical protein
MNRMKTVHVAAYELRVECATRPSKNMARLAVDSWRRPGNMRKAESQESGTGRVSQRLSALNGIGGKIKHRATSAVEVMKKQTKKEGKTLTRHGIQEP